MKGKLVTSTQYTNWITPDKMRKRRKESMNLRRAGVVSRYAPQRDRTAVADAVFVVEDGGGAGEETAALCFAELAVLGPAISQF